MALLVLGYPSLDAADYRRIQAFRADHDPQFRIIAPHFTLVHPVENVAEERLTAHVRRIAKAQPKINFVLRSAKFFPAYPGEGEAFIFLIPDEGSAALIQLHDQLYSGLLTEHLRADRPFGPHITIGRSADPDTGRQIVAELNREPVAMRGAIGRLTVSRYINGLITNLVEAPLLG